MLVAREKVIGILGVAEQLRANPLERAAESRNSADSAPIAASRLRVDPDNPVTSRRPGPSLPRNVIGEPPARRTSRLFNRLALPVERRCHQQRVAQGTGIVRADEIRAARGGVKLGRQRRRAALHSVAPPGDRAEKRFTRH